MSLDRPARPVQRRNPAGRFDPPVPGGVTYVEPFLRRVARRHRRARRHRQRARAARAPARPAADLCVPGGRRRRRGRRGRAGGCPRSCGSTGTRWGSGTRRRKQVFGHPRNPYHRVDCIRARRRPAGRGRRRRAGRHRRRDRRLRDVAHAEALRRARPRPHGPPRAQRRRPRTAPTRARPRTGAPPSATGSSPTSRGRYEDPLPECLPIAGLLAFDASEATVRRGRPDGGADLEVRPGRPGCRREGAQRARRCRAIRSRVNRRGGDGGPSECPQVPPRSRIAGATRRRRQADLRGGRVPRCPDLRHHPARRHVARIVLLLLRLQGRDLPGGRGRRRRRTERTARRRRPRPGIERAGQRPDPRGPDAALRGYRAGGAHHGCDRAGLPLRRPHQRDAPGATPAVQRTDRRFHPSAPEAGPRRSGSRSRGDRGGAGSDDLPVRRVVARAGRPRLPVRDRGRPARRASS